MTIQHRRRWKPQGRAHRARLADLLLPTLAVGAALPTGTWLGHWLGINPSEASRHLHRMLAEAGVQTETRGRGRCQRVYVVGMGYNGNAGQGMVPTGVSREQRDGQDREVPGYAISTGYAPERLRTLIVHASAEKGRGMS